MKTINGSTQAPVRIEPSWRTILECATIEVFQMMAAVNLETTEAESEEPPRGETAMVGLAGALCGMITLRCSQQTSLKLASSMLGEEAPTHATACSALGELCNMVAGNFKAKINALKDQCVLSVPTVISGEDYSMEPAERSEGLIATFMLEGEPIWVSLFAHT